MKVRTPDDFTAWSAARSDHVVFAGVDPHYALGLHQRLAGYRVACWHDAPAVRELARRGIPCFVVETSGRGDGTAAAVRNGSPDDTTGDVQNSAALVERSDVARFLDAEPGTALLVFKSSHRLERACRERGWPLVAASAALARRWENKVAFRAIGEALQLPQPPGLVFAPSEASYDDLRGQLGPTIVIQTPHGYSGARTYLVASAGAFRSAIAPLARQPVLRATAFIHGLPLTLNACVTARGIAVGALCYQLTGLGELTPYPLGSCGNDWLAAAERVPDVAPFVALATRIGRSLAAEGYRGVFGVDFVLGDAGDVFVIEVNPRLVASIALFTQLELRAGRLPLLARHLLAFLDPDADDAPLDAHLPPLAGGQVILHNVAAGQRSVTRSIDTGAYSVGDPPADQRVGLNNGMAVAATAPAAWRRPALGVDELADDEVLVLAPAVGLAVPSGAAYARVQSARRVVDADGALRPEIRAAMAAADVLGG